MKRPRQGARFTAKIDRISRSGNGIIELDDGHINIGPVKEGCTGKEIEATLKYGIFAECHTISVLPRGYTENFNNLRESSPTDTAEAQVEEENKLVGREVIVDITRTGLGGVPIGEHEGKPIHVPGAEVGAKVKIKITSNRKTFAMAKVIDEIEGNKEQSEPGEKEAEDIQTGSIDEIKKLETKTYTDYFGDKNDTSNDIDDLRKQADEAAVENVPKDASLSQQKTPEYTRSQKVREYVLARANGSCEGCGDSAPFISKTGDPYLHAHHIHELSNGGSDTPDTVIALCPNCHYQVHHGKDGDSYNQELLKIIKEIEDQ